MGSRTLASALKVADVLSSSLLDEGPIEQRRIETFGFAELDSVREELKDEVQSLRSALDLNRDGKVSKEEHQLNLSRISVKLDASQLPRICVYSVDSDSVSKARALTPDFFGGIEIEHRQGPLVTIDPNEESPPPPEVLYGGSEPHPCGSSVGLYHANNSGTLGAIVESDNPGLAGEYFGLSCSHVLSLCDYCNINEDIGLPSKLTAVKEGVEQRIAFSLHAIAPMVPGRDAANVDAALALCKDSRAISSSQGGDKDEAYDTPGNVLSLIGGSGIGHEVKKFGRTSGYSEGEVDAITTWLPIQYTIRGNGISVPRYYSFHNVLEIKSSDPSKIFGTRGDSGSLVSSREQDGAIGMIFAGVPSMDPDERVVFAHPIDLVLDAFKQELGGFDVSLVSGLNV